MTIFNRYTLGIIVTFLVLGVAGLVMAATAVNLGTADSFAVLGGSTVTNTGTTVVNGDLGLSPGLSVTGFLPGVVNGTQHVANTTATQAKTALTNAYNDAVGQTLTSTIASELGAITKTPGVYNSADGTFGITGTLTLDAGGDPYAVFIFKTATTLITGGASEIVLTNGAQACNVFWQVGSSATLGANSTFKGNILALTSVTLTTGANVEGRVFARNGAVTLDTNTVTKPTCVVPPPPPVPSGGSNFGAGNYWAPLPLINVVKTPSPLALPLGPGSVNYTYTVTNLGKVKMNGVWVKDDKCSTVTYVSGDTNKDLFLDLTETWKFSCTKTVSTTETNIATAHGQANGWDGYDTASATVVVGLPIVPPLIHLEKTPNVFVLPAGGGPVTYSYKVTNPGTAPLNNVSVIDDKCTGLPGRVAGHPGDLNQNNLLESNETWSFTCQSNITNTTTNIGTAEGHANGLTAIDFSSATVLVGAPALPNTGIAPDSHNKLFSIVAVGILSILALLYFVKQKQVV